MENGQEAAVLKPDTESFVEDMFDHGKELLVILRKEGDKNDIKDRITCLKYLEEITKTYFILKKASTHDPDAAGSTVRKYATAFAKNATGGGKARGRGRKPTTDAGELDLDSDTDSPDAAA